MKKHLFEWDIRDDAGEWDTPPLAILPQSSPTRAWSWEWRWWGIIALLLVVGGWLWIAEKRHSAYDGQEAGAVVESELAIANRGEVALGSAPATFESEFFLFQYDAQDAQAVHGAAARLDAIVPTLALSDLVAPPPDKWIIAVGQVEPANKDTHAVIDDSTIFVSISSMELTTIGQDEFLAQVILLEMLDRISADLIAHQAPNMALGSQERAQLERVLNSLRLWEIGNVDLPLAALDKPIVQWIYSDSQQGHRPLPEFAPALCELHHLWAEAPFLLRVPLFCGDAEAVDHAQLWRYLNESHGRLGDLSFFSAATPDQPFGDLASVVGLATVIDYISARYGRTSIADLVVSAPHYNGWETLIPVTFGVTKAEFEEGWQAHLQESYGVDLHISR